MEHILLYYLENKSWIELGKDLVYFVGAAGIIGYLYNWNFKNKTQQIEQDLKIRDALEDKLQKYVIEKHKNGIKDIGIRFIHWKNYPWRLENDAFKHLLLARSYDKNTTPSGWIDKTGINFEEHLWFSSTSIFVDKDGIFFFATEKGPYKGFKELKNICLVIHMPFSSIVNFDFKEYIEYEPIFYIKYPYTKYKKLYDSRYVVREKPEDHYFQRELNRNLKIKKYHSVKYYYLKLRVLCKSINRRFVSLV